jgi:hypothetical protein
MPVTGRSFFRVLGHHLRADRLRSEERGGIMTQPRTRRVPGLLYCSICGRRIQYEDEGGQCRKCGDPICVGCLGDDRICKECRDE